jgi:hypothetical protein
VLDSGDLGVWVDLPGFKSAPLERATKKAKSREPIETPRDFSSLAAAESAPRIRLTPAANNAHLAARLARSQWRNSSSSGTLLPPNSG